MSDKKALPPVKDKGEGGMDGAVVKPKNWSFFKKSDKTLRKMDPVLRSRYMAYEDPPKQQAETQALCKRRLVELRKEKRKNQPLAKEEYEEKCKHEKLIGQLKAAEARNRIRIMRLRYEANRGQEINHLIMCQPTARKAVRLQALLPARTEDRSQGDALDKLARSRIEALLEDTRGLLTGRT